MLGMVWIFFCVFCATCLPASYLFQGLSGRKSSHPSWHIIGNESSIGLPNVTLQRNGEMFFITPVAPDPSHIWPSVLDKALGSLGKRTLYPCIEAHCRTQCMC